MDFIDPVEVSHGQLNKRKAKRRVGDSYVSQMDIQSDLRWRDDVERGSSILKLENRFFLGDVQKENLNLRLRVLQVTCSDIAVTDNSASRGVVNNHYSSTDMAVAYSQSSCSLSSTVSLSGPQISRSLRAGTPEA